MRKTVAFTMAIIAAAAVDESVAAGQTPIVAEYPHEHRRYEGPPVVLTDLLREASENNLELTALRSQIEVARQRPPRERGLNPPMAMAQVWQWPIDSLNPANTNMYMFMVSQELPGRGKRDLRAAAAEKEVALAEAEVTIRARQIVNDIKHAYAALFIARQAIDVHLESVDLLRQIADAAQARYTTGRISQQDVLKPVLELSKLHNDIVMFDEQANVASARLNVLLGRAPETPIGPLAGPREQTLIAGTADLQRIAVDRHPELHRARLDIERAEAELAVARSESKPDFNVQGGYMVTPHQTDAWLGSVAISWPTASWARSKIEAHVAERTNAVDTARARTRALENSVRLAVHEAYVRAKAAQERAALLRTTILPQSQHTLEISRIAYQTDRVDFQSVIDSERMLLDARLSYVRAVSEFTQALADLERAVGSDLAPGTTSPANSQDGDR